MKDWKLWAPFSDLQGFVRVVLGVVIVLFLLRISGLRKFVA